MKHLIIGLISTLLMTSVVFADTLITDNGIVFDKDTGTVIDFAENECTEIELPETIQNIVVNSIEAHTVSNNNLKKIIIPESVKNFSLSMAGNEINEIRFYTKDCSFATDEPFYAGGRGDLKIYGYTDSTVYKLTPQWYFKFIALDENIQQGDINCDGRLDASDSALLLQKVLKNSTRVPSQYLQNADFVMDMTGDGNIATDDCATILQKVLHK